jgi:hypothetical protein
MLWSIFQRALRAAAIGVSHAGPRHGEANHVGEGAAALDFVTRDGRVDLADRGAAPFYSKIYSVMGLAKPIALHVLLSQGRSEPPTDSEVARAQRAGDGVVVSHRGACHVEHAELDIHRVLPLNRRSHPEKDSP